MGKYGPLIVFMYRAEGISWVKGSVSFVLKFALPPFSPPLPSGVQIRKQNMQSSGIRVATRVPVRSADEALVGSDHSLAADVQGNNG